VSSLFDKRDHGLGSPRGEHWSHRAACRDKPGEWWDQDGERLSEANRFAISVCAACPEAVPCLDAAIARGDDSSIRAGLTVSEIRAESHRRRQAVA